MHCTEYLFWGFLPRNLCIAWNSKEIPTSSARNPVRREISFAKTFRIQNIFRNGWSAELNISGGTVEKGSYKLCNISAKSAGMENEPSSNYMTDNKVYIACITRCGILSTSGNTTQDIYIVLPIYVKRRNLCVNGSNARLAKIRKHLPCLLTACSLKGTPRIRRSNSKDSTYPRCL